MIDLKPACRRMSDLLAAVSDDQLASSTPCAEYTVEDLIRHVDEVSQGFSAIARKDGDEPPADAALAKGSVDDWRDRVGKHVQTLGEVWDDPQAWQGSTDGAGVELPNELWGKIALTEVVVHGWDIARATGHPFDPPDHTLHACLGHVAEFVPNAPVPELWGPAVEVPAGAFLLDQVVAITGRTP